MRRREDGGRRPARNWFLPLGIVLCLEFWAVVATSVAQSL
jgi:hypothetical protein